MGITTIIRFAIRSVADDKTFHGSAVGNEQSRSLRFLMDRNFDCAGMTDRMPIAPKLLKRYTSSVWLRTWL